ncbi:MAG: FAD-dependent oxidoreductase [Prevotellaceae bacterium]|jgi:all-trans-retinol 13,14-reductase|nr:FAD-dependent oxidoreductase [Prevotellaceae bacterium]
MRQFDIIIIGSGLGGLECGYILAKKGYNVCILEKNPQLGGCLQTFGRGHFDTGFHYVGGLDEGQMLHTLFNYFDLLDLPWHRMDRDAFAEVIIDNRSYYYASGYDRFYDTLAEKFPHRRQQLKNYVSFLRQTGDNIRKSFSESNPNSELFERSAYRFLEQTIDDELLQNVLSGGSMTMELHREKLPLYIFAQINSSFIQSAWRLKGGGSLIARKLADSIRKMGGTVITKAEVTRLTEEDKKIKTLEVNGIASNCFEARYVISNLHPAATLALASESTAIRKIYRNRIAGLPDTFGMFTVHLQLKKDRIPYLNRNIFIHKENDLWNGRYVPDKKTSSVLLTFQLPDDDSSFTSNIDILTPMYWEEVAEWSDTTLHNRGAKYEEMKHRKAEECIRLACERMPELRNSIERYVTSTPLTYRDYTASRHGSAYGIQKDYRNVMQTLLTPQTPVSNLLMTGQNLNLHGILGVSITSFFTCAKIVGMHSLVRDLQNVFTKN